MSTTASGRAFRNAKADWKMHGLSIFSLAVAFVCLAAALLVVTNLESVRARWSKVGRATVYLRDGAEPAAVQDLREALLKTEGVRAVRLVTAEESRRELVTESGDASIAGLPPQAFSASLDIDFGDKTRDEDIVAVTQKLKGIGIVDGVETYGRWSERLSGLLHGGMTAALVLAVVVLGAVVSVVGSTMRMALERRRVEVEVLRMVGATSSYVRAPFVVEGAAQGAVGAALAIALLGLLYAIVKARLDGTLGLLLGVDPSFLPIAVIAGMVALGGALGAGSSYMSLRRLVTL